MPLQTYLLSKINYLAPYKIHLSRLNYRGLSYFSYQRKVIVHVRFNNAVICLNGLCISPAFHCMITTKWLHLSIWKGKQTICFASSPDCNNYKINKFLLHGNKNCKLLSIMEWNFATLWKNSKKIFRRLVFSHRNQTKVIVTRKLDFSLCNVFSTNLTR